MNRIRQRDALGEPEQAADQAVSVEVTRDGQPSHAVDQLVSLFLELIERRPKLGIPLHVREESRVGLGQLRVLEEAQGLADDRSTVAPELVPNLVEQVEGRVVRSDRVSQLLESLEVVVGQPKEAEICICIEKQVHRTHYPKASICPGDSFTTSAC